MGICSTAHTTGGRAPPAACRAAARCRLAPQVGQAAKLGGEIVEMDNPIGRASKFIKEMPAALAERLGIGKKEEPAFSPRIALGL